MSTPPIDLIVTGARLHALADGDGSADGATTEATALAVAGGRIVAVGSRSEIAALADDRAERLEFAGGTIVPAFTDAHAHPVASVSIPQGTDLSGLLTRAELREALERGAAEQAGSDWFFASGLDPNAFEGAPITNEILAEVLGPDRLAHVGMFDGHSALASDALLRLAGITEGRSYPDGSSIVADASGRPTGHVLEFSALNDVRAHLPARTPEDQARELHALLGAMAATGISRVHVMDLQGPDAIAILEAAEQIAPLPVTLRISPWCEPGTSDREVDELIALQGRGGDRWSIGGIKFFIDGTVEGGTAWLETPDIHGENTESVWRDRAAYAARIARFHAAGIPTATHAIGERGIRFVVDTLAALPAGGPQHRIEHIESVARDVIDRLGAAGIAASMQPTHCTHYTRADGSDDWSQRLGETRAHRAWCTRDVRDAGAILALGSDFPVAPFNPLEIMADAQLRRPAGSPAVEPVLPEQGLTAREALEGYTTQPGAAIGERTGRLAVGEPASFAVLDVDPLAAAPDALAAGRVLLTVSEGLVTHRG